jgi:hypothetical protein
MNSLDYFPVKWQFCIFNGHSAGVEDPPIARITNTMLHTDFSRLLPDKITFL